MNSENPKLSVIIAAYNSEKYLEESVCSVLKSTFEDIEVIIVNDGSTDSTLEIAEGIAKKDERVGVINLDKNEGAAHARNEGIKKSRGIYVCFFDSDDISIPNRFEKQIEYLDNHRDIGFVYGDIIINFPDGKKEIIESIEFSRNPAEILKESVERDDIKEDEEPAKYLDKNKFIPVGSVVARKELFDKFRFDEQLSNCEDYDLWLQMIGHGIKCSRIPVLAYIYRIHENQKSKYSEKKLQSIKRIRDKLKSR